MLSTALILGMAWTIPAQAEDLSLETVLRAALTNGTKIKHAENNLKIAEARLKQAQGAFDWRATARAGWTRIYYPRRRTIAGVNVLTDETISSDAQQVTLGVSKVFRNGLQIEPGVTYFANAPSQGETLGQTRPQPTLNLQIPLLQVFGGDNQAAANERAAASDVLGAQFQRDASAQQATLDAAQTYWRCLAAQDQENMLASDRKSADTYLSVQRALFDKGQIAPTSINSARVREATRATQYNRIREINAACRVELGILLDTADALTLPTLARAFADQETLTAQVSQLSEAALLDTALRNRIDMRALEQYVAAARARLEGAKSGLDPKLGLSVNPDGIFVSVSRSLGMNAEEGAVQEAEARLREAELTLQELRNQIRRDVSAGFTALKNSLAILGELRESDAALAKILDDSRRAFEIGGLDLEELRTYEMEQADVAVQLSQARLDVALNLASLRLVTGTIEFADSTAPSKDAGLFRSLSFGQ